MWFPFFFTPSLLCSIHVLYLQCIKTQHWRSPLWITPPVRSINPLFKPKSTKVIPQLSSLVNRFWSEQSLMWLWCVFSSRISGISPNSLLQRWPAPRSSSSYVSCSARPSPHNTRQTSFDLLKETEITYCQFDKTGIITLTYLLFNLYLKRKLFSVQTKWLKQSLVFFICSHLTEVSNPGTITLDGIMTLMWTEGVKKAMT